MLDSPVAGYADHGSTRGTRASLCAASMSDLATTVSVVSELPDLRGFVRDEPALREVTVVVRGGPDAEEKLAIHAERLRRAYVLDGEPVLGISVFAASDDIGPASVDGILSGKLSTHRVVHMASLKDLVASGFAVLPTFGRPHMTIVLSGLDRVQPLLAVLGPARTNPHYGEMVRRRGLPS